MVYTDSCLIWTILTPLIMGPNCYGVDIFMHLPSWVIQTLTQCQFVWWNKKDATLTKQTYRRCPAWISRFTGWQWYPFSRICKKSQIHVKSCDCVLSSSLYFRHLPSRLESFRKTPFNLNLVESLNLTQSPFIFRHFSEKKSEKWQRLDWLLAPDSRVVIWERALSFLGDKDT